MLRAPAVALAVCVALAAQPAIAQGGGDASFAGAGAAMCIAAGEMLAANGGPRTEDEVRRWRQVLHVMDGTPEQRAAAVENARESLARNDGLPPGLMLVAARSLWDAGCARDMQVRYIAVHGSEERALRYLAERLDQPISAELASAINVHASCLAAASLFQQRSPSRALRRALSQAAPAPPSVDQLAAITERASAEIAAADASDVGKQLVVEYVQYLYATAAGGDTPQGFINNASATLNSRCAPQQADAPNG